MALSEDQRALLRLLLSGDTYEQVAAVLGVSPDEVRTRAHQAAAELERAPDQEFPPQRVTQRLNALESPSAAVETQASTAPAAGRSRPWPLWLGLGAAAVAVVVVLVVVLSGGSSSDDGATVGAHGDQEDVVPIKLAPVGGSGASGMISVVRVADQPAVDLAIEGLQPSRRGETYVLWFVGSGGRSLPVAFQAVGADGKLTGRTPIPTAAEGFLPSFTAAVLTLTHQEEAASVIRQAAQSATLPEVVGTPVMRGELR
jgi:hypothetical protein